MHVILLHAVMISHSVFIKIMQNKIITIFDVSYLARLATSIGNQYMVASDINYLLLKL